MGRMPDATRAGGADGAPAVRPPSYRALLDVPTLPRALAGTQLARIAGSMLGVAIVLFSLAEYGSPSLAGLITFVGIFPGLVVSPIAGALLDRHGRTRLIALDFLVAMAAMLLIGCLALVDRLELPVVFAIAGLASLTGPLSNTGLRTLFPLIVPRPLWERLNAVDSNGWVIASIVGPPIAAIAVGLVGGAWTLILVGLLFGLAAWVVAGVPEPPAPSDATGGHLLRDALAGLRYAWSNRTIRGLGLSVSLVNVTGGIVSIVIPLLVLDRLGLGEPVVGLLFAVQGVAGVTVGFLAGRLDTRGRERLLVAIPILGFAPATALLFGAELPLLVLSMALAGMLVAPMDVAMFTIRQRRTDPAWLGRAFAVSMALNFSGYPIGAALGGALAAISIELAIGVAVVMPVVAGIAALAMIPARATEYDPAVA